MSKLKNSPRQRNGLKIVLALFAGAVLLAVIGGMIVFGLNLLGFWGHGQAALAPASQTSKVPPEAVAARQEAEGARLSSYGWVDKEAGLVRIPIDQAMMLVADNGLPVGAPAATVTSTATRKPTATRKAATATRTPRTTGTPAPRTGTPAPTGSVTPGVEPSSPVATPGPTVDLANVSFQDHVLPIFEQHCTECHGQEEPEEGLRLTSYDEVMAGSWNGSVIEPGDAENSYLVEQVVRGRMPKRGPKLTPAEIDIITAWVEAGALDN